MATTSEAPYYDLGAYHRPVSTKSNEAQTWFDRGLVCSYAFNHEEAVECFERTTKADADCAMAYFGLAYALGPNYNKPWDLFDGEELGSTVIRTHAAVKKAKAAASNASLVEKALIDALQHRYPDSKPAPDFNVWNQQYAKAMKAVYTAHPHDLDVATLYADALMNLTPWRLWDIRIGKPSSNAHTTEVKDILERAMTEEGGLLHPGLLHLYIHLMEMSPTPEKAMPYADCLRGLVPDAGHLQHMPSHLDILCGDYRRAIASNMDAIRADERFLARAGPLNFYTLYRCHNYHFRLYAALFAGQSKIALETCDWIESTVPEELLHVKSPPMADWLEAFHGMRVHALVRFGFWRQLIELPFPEDRDLYCVTIALIHYGKGIAHAAVGNTELAEKEQNNLRDAITRVKKSRTLFNNACTDIVAIAELMLRGEIEYRRRKFDDAFTHLVKAISLDDSLPYDEPWGWMQPPRHAYGALLLERVHVEKACDVYEADLGFNDSLPRPMRHPNNVWALHGYHECLLRLGRTAEARVVKPQLDFALAMADIPINSSCFCRTDQHKSSSLRP
jgi:tetratricopeptide (TPR) repeat protein